MAAGMGGLPMLRFEFGRRPPRAIVVEGPARLWAEPLRSRALADRLGPVVPFLKDRGMTLAQLAEFPVRVGVAIAAPADDVLASSAA